MEINKYKENIITCLKDFNVEIIYIFGSFARNELREDSDIDIAFLSNKEIDEYQCFMKGQEIANLIKREVDLIDLRKASTVFKTQIITNGFIIYSTDNVKKAYFEMKSLKEYALLNEERKVILNRINREGTIYGK